MCAESSYLLAGALHLAGWGYEQGAIWCSPDAMMAVDETPLTGACYLQGLVPVGVK